MLRRWIWLAICVPGFIAPAHAFCSDSGRHQAGLTVESVSPQEWARLCLEQCRTVKERRTDTLSSLREYLVHTAQSIEEKSFPDREASAYDRVLEKERRIRDNQLNYLLFKSKGKVLKEMIRQRLQGTSSSLMLEGNLWTGNRPFDRRYHPVCTRCTREHSSDCGLRASSQKSVDRSRNNPHIDPRRG